MKNHTLGDKTRRRKFSNTEVTANIPSHHHGVKLEVDPREDAGRTQTRGDWQRATDRHAGQRGKDSLEADEGKT